MKKIFGPFDLILPEYQKASMPNHWHLLIALDCVTNGIKMKLSKTWHFIGRVPAPFIQRLEMSSQGKVLYKCNFLLVVVVLKIWGQFHGLFNTYMKDTEANFL